MRDNNVRSSSDPSYHVMQTLNDASMLVFHVILGTRLLMGGEIVRTHDV
jgi:hypothetical protein